MISLSMKLGSMVSYKTEHLYARKKEQKPHQCYLQLMTASQPNRHLINVCYAGMHVCVSMCASVFAVCCNVCVCVCVPVCMVGSWEVPWWCLQ